MAYKIPKDELGLVTSGEFYGVATGGPIDYFVSLNNPIGPLNLAMVGKMFKVRFNVANTTNSASLNVSGVGSLIPLTKNGGQSLSVNDILIDEILLLVFDGSNYQIIGKIPANNSLPSSGNVNAPLIWDGNAWVAGAAPAVIPVGAGVNHILQWDGVQWVSTYSSSVSGISWKSYEVQLSEFVGASLEFFALENKTIYYIDVNNFIAGQNYKVILPSAPRAGSEMVFIGRGFKHCLFSIDTIYPNFPLVKTLVHSQNPNEYFPYPLTWFVRHYIYSASYSIGSGWTELWL